MFSSFIHVNSRVLFFMAELCVSVYVCESLSDSLHPMDYSPPGSSVHGLLQARVLEWVVSLSIHLLIGCFPILAIKNKTARNVGVQLPLQDLFFFFFKFLLEYHWFKILISFPSDKYPEVGLLDHMVTLFLTFSGSSILFSIEAAPIYTPPSVYGRRGSGSLFSTSSPTLFFLSVKCEVLGDWFAFVWWLVVLSTFLCAHRPFVCLLWENLFGFSAHLVTWWWWWFCYFVVSSLYPPIRYMVWKYFLP